MNYLASSDIWGEKERRQTLADISFAPTSVNGVEFPDDVEPDMYRANRAAMEANGKNEMAELVALDQRTTAYPSLSCTAGPMSPAYKPAPLCDLNSMRDVSHGVTAYTQQGQPLFPQYNQQRQSVCGEMKQAGVGMGAPNPALVRRASGEPPIGYAPNTYFKYDGVEEKKKKNGLREKTRHMGVRMMNSVRGAVYDMQHFSELPPAQSGEAPSQVAWYAVSRDNRFPYILLIGVAIVALIAMILGIKAHEKK